MRGAKRRRRKARIPVCPKLNLLLSKRKSSTTTQDWYKQQRRHHKPDGDRFCFSFCHRRRFWLYSWTFPTSPLQCSANFNGGQGAGIRGWHKRPLRAWTAYGGSTVCRTSAHLSSIGIAFYSLVRSLAVSLSLVLVPWRSVRCGATRQLLRQLLSAAPW